MILSSLYADSSSCDGPCEKNRSGSGVLTQSAYMVQRRLHIFAEEHTTALTRINSCVIVQKSYFVLPLFKIRQSVSDNAEVEL
uniref:Uncharacterized protein n=1 Tax=Arundo donax TaxID=35708 RepID=A0A0A9GFM4_ARUDO